MALKLFGRLDTVRVLVRVACAAISLNAIPHARGAETVPAHVSGLSHGVAVEAAIR